MKRIDLLGPALLGARASVKNTVLHRPGKPWVRTEQFTLGDAIHNETSTLPAHPDYMLLPGHHDEAKIRAAIPGDDYTVRQVTGVTDLPYIPGWVA
jgi:hypothetical protein